MSEFASYTLNKYQLGANSKTPYGRLHGREASEKRVEFGERILWFVPKRLRPKLDKPWRFRIFLGRSMSSDQNFVGISGGTAVRSRAILQLIPDLRWDAARVIGVRVSPLEEDGLWMDKIERGISTP